MNYQKPFIFAIIGGGFGIVLGYMAAKKQLESQYQADIAEYKQFLNDKFGISSTEDEPCEDDTDEEIRQYREKTASEFGGTVQKSSLNTEKSYKKLVTNYHKPDLSELVKRNADEPAKNWPEGDDEDGYEGDDDSEPDENDEEEGEKLADVENEEPYLIDQNQFMHENPHFDKIDLYYYRFDDTICDDKDVKMDDAEDILGWDFYNTLKRQTLAYVRNERLHSDFEIHALSKSYSEDVEGKAETDKEREMRRLARHKEALDGEDED